ncbi:MAG: hypothetical protein KJ592_02950 [Nanoarchaeota archaeon]|nr:hypothetical protein [Nanoarchaeota archaeon]
MIDIQEKKRKIISFLETNGPSLPVRIAKIIEMEPVFTSAILSELSESKQIKTSHMKIGASSLYLLPDQDQKLEEHTDDLKSIEKEAYLKIKNKKILIDETEDPAIRVALRNIKDFATPFKFQEKIMWKYAFSTEEEIEKLLSPPKPKTNDQKLATDDPVPKAWEAKKEEIKQAKENSKKIESIFEKPKTISPTTKEKKSINDKTFLEEVEEFLEKQNTKIISMEEVDKKKVIAKTQSESEEAILFAFNKRKIDEQELMKCYKKAKSLNLPYHIIILGDLTKKMDETIDAYKTLIKVQKLKN